MQKALAVELQNVHAAIFVLMDLLRDERGSHIRKYLQQVVKGEP